jgi:hypothetical protein
MAEARGRVILNSEMGTTKETKMTKFQCLVSESRFTLRVVGLVGKTP